MERYLNNEDILKFGTFNHNQIFFIQRWLELLNIHTHSKYAVRFLNTHQALKELNYVCNEMIEGNIKRNDNHLRLVFQEVKKVLEEDVIFKENAHSHFKILENSLQSAPKADNVSKLYSIIFQIEYVLRHINTKYLTWIITNLNQMLSSNEKKYGKIERDIQILASELLGRGWSADALYSLVNESYKDDTYSVEGRFEKLFSKFNDDPQTYVFLFAIKNSIATDTKAHLIELGREVLNGEEVVNTYSGYDLEKNISKVKEYIRIITQCYDTYSGVNKAWQSLVGSLDILNFYGFNIPDIDTAPIILVPDSQTYIRNVKVDLVAKKRKFKAPETIMNRVHSQLKSSNTDVNRKIQSLFEFSRISEESLSPQSTFINLWIAIESFAQSNEFDGGIENVKMVVSASATHNYLYGLLRNFLEDCNRCGLEVTFEGTTYQIGKLSPQEALYLFWNDEFYEIMKIECEHLNYLLAFRYTELFSILKDGKKCANLLEFHKENIQQHVHRLYRIRNAIVHSGEMQYSINLFTKHLYEYIQYVMSVVMHRLAEEPTVYLEQIFAQVRDSVDATIETLKNSRLLDEDAYFSLLLKGAF